MDISSTSIWKQLESLVTAVPEMKALFESDANRAQKYSIDACGISLDYSKNRINQDVVQGLISLAEQQQVSQKRDAMFAGETINITEERSVLHTALRYQGDEQILVDGKDIMPDVRAVQQKMKQLVDAIYSGTWKGMSGKAITDVVSIGIGGSFLGPKIMTEALKPYQQNKVKVHFVANVDGCHIHDVLQNVNIETTLFIMSSKSFSTQETLRNTLTAKAWFLENGGDQASVAKHFMAISTNIKAATEFGIHEDNILPLWDWVGGRYSLWSAIGLPIAIAIGYDNFEALLKGADAMDTHFKTAPLSENMPVIMALLGVWYTNFHGAQSHVLLPYYHYLRGFPAYVQQLDMESNGKACTMHSDNISYSTGPVIWGSEGTNGQHSFHQLIHQGNLIIPADFMLPLNVPNEHSEHHAMLASNCFAQSQALMQGKTLDEARQEVSHMPISDEQKESLAAHKYMPGNRPSNTLLFEQLDPQTLGALVALYEHKVFVQGAIWDLNSFDQWGVELGKVLGNQVLDAIHHSGDSTQFDSSTNYLVNRFKHK